MGRPERRDAVITGAGRAMGRATALDILVKNAGITRDRTFHNLDDAQWDFVLDVDLRSAFHVTVAAPTHVGESAKQETAERGTPDHRPGA